jgi:predicted membrane chloride channel (bestrophin family)
MIYYDSHKWWTILIQRKGSVFPRACITSIPVAILTFVIKYLELEGHFSFADLGLIENSAVYSGFSFTISFVLVFRTSMSYNRFWISATAVNAMKTNWFEAAGSLINFVGMSKGSPDSILLFKHKVVRLFSMLNATALGAIASMRDENFPIIDVHAWKPEDIECLRYRDDLEKAEIVYRWITCLIIQQISSGVLNVPPPILTRVFQQMENGIVNFNLIVQIMTIPFPFPFAQVTVVLNMVYSFFTPLVMCTWSQHAISAALFTFICVVGLKSIDLITTELENPFGDDPNDLPVHEFHRQFNGQLVLLLDPVLDLPPAFGPNTEWDHAKLTETVRTRQNESLHAVFDGIRDVPVEEDKDIALDGSWQQAHEVEKARVEKERQAQEERLAHEPKDRPQNPQTEMMTQIMSLLHQGLQQGQGSSSSSVSPNAGQQSGSGVLLSPTGTAAPPEGWHEVFLQQQNKAHKEFLSVLSQIATRIDQGFAAAGQPGQQQGLAPTAQPQVRSRYAPPTVLPPCLSST